MGSQTALPIQGNLPQRCCLEAAGQAQDPQAAESQKGKEFPKDHDVSVKREGRIVDPGSSPAPDTSALLTLPSSPPPLFLCLPEGC